MGKIDQIDFSSARAVPADVVERAVAQARERQSGPVARASCIGSSNQIDGRMNCNSYVRTRRCRAPASRAMPIPQVGWCRILFS